MSKCPVCYYDCAPAIHSLTAEEAAQHFVQGRGSAQRNRELSVPIYNLWGARNCYIRRCGACEFCFADPFIAGDKTFYNLAYERSVYPADKWEFDRTLEELSRMSFRAERVLEAGAGFGFFLDKIVENRVPPIGVAALEYSDEAVKKLQSKGYFVLQQDLRNANFDQPFDAIFLFQVVEHMDDLDGLFGRISQLLRNDGLLFIAVPNAGRVAFNEQNGSLLDTPPNHIGRWSPAAFQFLDLGIA